ncbi:beta-ureidopropionase-like [Colias croceus]|uniref:beta-ureidopropionase-like n=1 Tax=Colias crocea TaxID=72248 RepID=UPI001E27CA5E|nr:beta-ureidopropionase-like [Colias croceus]
MERSLDDVIKNNLSGNELREFNRIYYGRSEHCELKINNSTKDAGVKYNFDVLGYAFHASKEQLREPRILRLGLVQHSIVLSTDKPINEQRQAIFDKVERIIDAAASEAVKILCLQETWSMPFFLCTREKERWADFAESAVDGPSTKFLSKLAKKYEIIIISPILENEDGVWWNTAVVINEQGNYVGKHRKNHLPSVGSFSETSYYEPGNTNHPVFDTKYGKIAVNICYGRHHALNWLMFALNRAEVVFNPSATISEFGESFWGIEARNAAIANGYVTCSINRVGTEEFTVGKDTIKRSYYGSSYVTAPNGFRTPGLPRNRDGLLIAEVDLNQCRQI